MKFSSECLGGLHEVAIGYKKHKSVEKFGLGRGIRVPTLTPFTLVLTCIIRVSEPILKIKKKFIRLQNKAYDPLLERKFKDKYKFENHFSIGIKQKS